MLRLLIPAMYFYVKANGKWMLGSHEDERLESQTLVSAGWFSPMEIRQIQVIDADMQQRIH